MWKTAVIVAVLTAGATSAFAWVNLEATCAGGQAQIYLRIGNTYGPEFVGVVVTRYQMGSCEAPAVVTESPIALPPVDVVCSSSEMRSLIASSEPGTPP